MSWQPYRIDDCARQVVLKALQRDPKGESLSQVFKMRVTCAYGLERFWGEYLRLKQKSAERMKAEIILDTWRFMSEEILADTGIDLPFEPNLTLNDQAAVRRSLVQLWDLRATQPYQAQVALSVLTTFCEAIIWWKNRLAVK